MYRLTIYAAVLAAAAPATPALAQTGTATVRYADLNLATETGRAVFDRRLDRAARSACAALPTGTLAIDAAGKRCMIRAVADAQPAIDAAFRRSGTATLAAAAAPVLTLRGAR